MPDRSEAELPPDERNQPRGILNPLLGVPNGRLEWTSWIPELSRERRERGCDDTKLPECRGKRLAKRQEHGEVVRRGERCIVRGEECLQRFLGGLLRVIGSATSQWGRNLKCSLCE